jgi:hypothetical protein
MTNSHFDFEVNGFTVGVSVGGDPATLDAQAVAELGDVVNFAVAWAHKHGRGLRIPKIPAPPHYEPPPPVPGEIWRRLPGFEHSHEVSNCYRVRSIDRVVPMADRWHSPLVYDCPQKIEKAVRGRILKTRLKGFIVYVTLCCPDGTQRAFQVRNLVHSAFPELLEAEAQLPDLRAIHAACTAAAEEAYDALV